MILAAQRAFSRDLMRPNRPVQRQGLAYERKAIAALREANPAACATLEHNPWFKYQDSSRESLSVCCPDAVLDLRASEALVIVFEMKLTWVAEAASKLKSLYLPVVSRALDCRTLGVIICKHLTLDSPSPSANIFPDQTIPALEPRVYHWIGKGNIQW